MKPVSFISKPSTPEQFWREYRPDFCKRHDCGYSSTQTVFGTVELRHLDGQTHRTNVFPVTEQKWQDVNADIWAEFKDWVISLHLAPTYNEGAYVYE